ncbi:hypothetical protein [Spirosoma aerolatum]|uniref:hypothetical protein n=1 Tax=Spirosoma aerolatum TaxID=1211326 RepID=UPI0012D2EDD8|nr:hypothetical protein [Spirosoma aerolatum]
MAVFSCQPQQKFDKEKWNEVGDLMTFPNRKYMIDDLTQHYNLKGKTYKEVIDLLNQPQDGLDSTGQIAYNIDIDYGVEDPVYSKRLIVHFSKDSVATGYRIHEWRK